MHPSHLISVRNGMHPSHLISVRNAQHPFHQRMRNANSPIHQRAECAASIHGSAPTDQRARAVPRTRAQAPCHSQDCGRTLPGDGTMRWPRAVRLCPVGRRAQLGLHHSDHSSFITCHCAPITHRHRSSPITRHPSRITHHVITHHPSRNHSSLIIYQIGGLNDAHTVQCAACAVAALGALHERGWIYRDVKAENFVFMGSGCLKLVDLGLATRVPPSGKCFTAVGTCEYMAPEVIKQTSGYDASVDWWGVGCLVYEMRYAHTPWLIDQRGKLEDHTHDTAISRRVRVCAHKRSPDVHPLCPSSPSVPSTGGTCRSTEGTSGSGCSHQ